MKQNQYPEVFNRLDQAYAVWEQSVWKTRWLRCIKNWYKFKVDRNKENTEKRDSIRNLTGYPIDGSEKTKDLLNGLGIMGDCRTLLPKMEKVGLVPEDLFDENSLEVMHNNPEWDAFKTFSPMLLFPYFLGRWSQCSRRMYHLSDDLVLLLQHTSLEGVCLNDIHFPFKSFVVTLDTPISLSGEDFDAFLFTDVLETIGGILTFPSSYETWKPISSKHRKAINRAIKKDDFDVLNRPTLVKHLEESQSDKPRLFIGLQREGIREKQITDILHELTDATEESSGVDKVLRIAIGLCLYLRSTDCRDGAVDEPRKFGSNVGVEIRKGEALLDSAEICHVQSVVKLSLDDRKAIRQALSDEESGRYVRAHFRQGHWRRPPGQGDDPTAEKTVWVRPTIVCKENLPEGAMPLGTGQMLTV